MIREEQAKSGFCGPDARSIEDIGDRALAEIDDLLFAWTARIAAQPRAQTAKLEVCTMVLVRRHALLHFLLRPTREANGPPHGRVRARPRGHRRRGRG